MVVDKVPTRHERRAFVAGSEIFEPPVGEDFDAVVVHLVVTSVGDREAKHGRRAAGVSEQEEAVRRVLLGGAQLLLGTFPAKVGVVPWSGLVVHRSGRRAVRQSLEWALRRRRVAAEDRPGVRSPHAHGRWRGGALDLVVAGERSIVVPDPGAARKRWERLSEDVYFGVIEPRPR